MAKLYGQLERAQIENLAADPTGVDLVEGRIWFRTDLDVFRAVANSVVVEFADLATAQTFSNKTLANPSVEGYIDIDQIATPANPGSGILRIYQKADGKLYTLDENGNELPLGSGSGSGGINYIPEDSRDIESTVGQWLTDDGGGSASGLLTLSTTSVVGEVLRSGSSLKLAKSGADANGHFMKCLTLDINPEDYETSNAIYFNCSFKPLTGYVADDLVLEFYDVANAQVLYSRGITGIEAAQGKLTAVTFLETTTTQVEVRARVDNTNTNSFEVVMDGFEFGPDKIIDTVITENIDETVVSPTIAAAGTEVSNFANLQLTGSRVGGAYHLGVKFTHDIVTGNNSDQLQIDITNDFAFLAGKTITHVQGSFASNVNSATAGRSYVFGEINRVSNNIRFEFFGDFANLTNRTCYGNLTIYVEDEVDQTAVLSTTEMLNTSTSARYYLSGNQSILTTSETGIVFDSITSESGGALSLNPSTGVVTFNKSGKYKIDLQYPVQNQTVGEQNTCRVKINGVAKSFRSFFVTNSTFAYVTVGDSYDVKAGDTLSVTNDSTSDANYIVAASESLAYLNIVKVEDLSVYSVYGNAELYTGTSTDFRLDTAGYASGEWAQLTGNSVTLGPGTWILDASTRINDGGVNPVVNAVTTVWSDENGDNTTGAPNTSVPGMQLVRAQLWFPTGTANIVSQSTFEKPPEVFIATEETIIYLVPRVNFTSPGDASVQVTYRIMRYR